MKTFPLLFRRLICEGERQSTHLQGRTRCRIHPFRPAHRLRACSLARLLYSLHSFIPSLLARLLVGACNGNERRSFRQIVVIAAATADLTRLRPLARRRQRCRSACDREKETSTGDEHRRRDSGITERIKTLLSHSRRLITVLAERKKTGLRSTEPAATRYRLPHRVRQKYGHRSRPTSKSVKALTWNASGWSAR